MARACARPTSASPSTRWRPASATPSRRCSWRTRAPSRDVEEIPSETWARGSTRTARRTPTPCRAATCCSRMAGRSPWCEAGDAAGGALVPSGGAQPAHLTHPRARSRSQARPSPRARPQGRAPPPPSRSPTPPRGTRAYAYAGPTEPSRPLRRRLHPPRRIPGPCSASPPAPPRTRPAGRSGRCVAQYHPDKVAHLAPEFQELAERKTRELLEAWEQLEKELSGARGHSRLGRGTPSSSEKRAMSGMWSDSPWKRLAGVSEGPRLLHVQPAHPAAREQVVQVHAHVHEARGGEARGWPSESNCPTAACAHVEPRLVAQVVEHRRGRRRVEVSAHDERLALRVLRSATHQLARLVELVDAAAHLVLRRPRTPWRTAWAGSGAC